MTLRIEKTNHDVTPTIRLIGRIRAEHLSAITAEIQRFPIPAQIDLGDITNLDVEAVGFLSAREAEGFQLINCSPFIREWIQRERARKGSE